MIRKVGYSETADRQMRKLPHQVAQRIDEKMHQYAADPASLANNVITMQGGSGLLRLRVGDWRVIFTDDGTVVTVTKVGPRGGVYR